MIQKLFNWLRTICILVFFKNKFLGCYAQIDDIKLKLINISKRSLLFFTKLIRTNNMQKFLIKQD